MLKFPIEKHWRRIFYNSATGRFSPKIFILRPPPCHTGSNDTSLMSVWPPGAIL